MVDIFISALFGAAALALVAAALGLVCLVLAVTVPIPWIEPAAFYLMFSGAVFGMIAALAALIGTIFDFF